MTAPLESSIVRLRKSNGAVVGAGFLVAEKYVLTCAHVVADALGIARDTQKRPTEDVYLDFPLVAPEERLTAGVVFWRPVPLKGSTSVKGKEDIAGLELKSTLPEGVQPVDLIIEEDLRGHSFRTFGFPSGHDDGLEATGVLRGRQGTGWVQLEDVKQTGVRLEPGFSGTPVWDEQLNGVVGMAVAADQKRPEAKVAFMIPTEVLATAWSALGKLTIPPLILYRRKYSEFWHERSLTWVSVVLIVLLGATLYSLLQSRSLFGFKKPTCIDLAHKERKLVIAIANFDEGRGDPNKDLETEKRIEEELIDRIPDKVAVCRVPDKALGFTEAQKLGDALKAAIVIWGRRDSLGFDVGIKVVNPVLKQKLSLSVPFVDISSFNLKLNKLPELMPVLTALALSQSYYFSEQNLKQSRSALKDVLEVVDERKISESDKITKQELAKAYFFLAILFHTADNFSCQRLSDCEYARDNYKKAYELDPTLYSALLQQGVIDGWLGKESEAMAVYEKLIDANPPSHLTAIALTNRAYIMADSNCQNAEDELAAAIKLERVIGLQALARIRLNQCNNLQGALKASTLAVDEDPSNIESYNLLALSQFQTGNTQAALTTYRKAICYLEDEESQIYLIDRLTFLAEDKPELKPNINTAIGILKAARVSQTSQCHTN